MATVIVEMEESAFMDLNGIINKAEEDARLVSYYTDLFFIVEAAARMGNRIHVNDKDELCVNNTTTTQLIMNMQGAINESRTTDAG